MSSDLGHCGWLYENGKFQGLQVGTKVVCTKSKFIGHVGVVIKLHTKGFITYIFPNISYSTMKWSSDVSKSVCGITVIPIESNLTRKMSEDEARSHYKKSGKPPVKPMKTLADSVSGKVLMQFLDNSYVVDIILDYEKAIELWFSPLGWVFEDGKYKGLRKGTKVVCTKTSFVGHVGYVDTIHTNSKDGLVTYYFPMYGNGRCPEKYDAIRAENKWGLCVVPDGTDVHRILSKREALSYVRVKDY